jgi:hypothetical protein
MILGVKPTSLRAALILGGLTMVPMACRAQHAPTPAVQSQAAASPAAAADNASGHTFSSPKLGISLAWPSGWSKKESNDYELLLSPDHGPDGAALSLDVPDLPAHVPGMIPIGMVKNGYVDDLKKSHGQVQIQEETPKVEGASARKVHATWKQDGKEFQETALLLVHKDRVYILRSNSAAADEATIKGAYDEFVKSLKWVKK